MALDGTYGGLKASLALWLNRGDLTAAIPDFVALGAASIGRQLRHYRQLTRITITVDAQFEDAPADFAGPYYLRETAQAPYRALDWIDPAQLADLGGYFDQQAGTPTKYTVLGSQLGFSPAPSASVSMELVYYASLPALSVDGDSNWLLTAHPDAYLYGALVAAAPYLIEDERVVTWGTLFTKSIDEINRSSLMQMQGAQVLVRPNNPLAP